MTDSVASSWPPYVVAARNISRHDDPNIHDDAEARRRGFKGGLVAGRVLFSHLLHPVVAHYGLTDLRHSRLTVRFQKPAYEGDRIKVTRAATADMLTLQAHNDEGMPLAELTVEWPEPFPAPDARAATKPPPGGGERPMADWECFTPGTALAAWHWQPDARDNLVWCESIGETLSAFHEGVPLLLHPGLIPTATTEMLHANLRIVSWVHVGSTFVLHELPRVGQELELRATLERKWERTGRRFAEVYVAILADGILAVEEQRTALFTKPKPQA